MAKQRKQRQKRSWRRRRRVIATALLVGAVIVAVGMAVWTGRAPEEGRVGKTASGDRLHRVSTGHLPAFAASASSQVQAVYLYAANHSEVLRFIPCYCGCGSIGHRHNGDCYVHARNADGTVTFTSHGAT